MLQAIIIPMPDVNTNLPSLTHVTFNNMAKSSKSIEICDIPDKVEFENSLFKLGEPGWIQLKIKAPGTAFFIPPEYKQFVPTIRKMIDDHYKSNSWDSFFHLGIFQGTIEPLPNNSNPFTNAHRDIWLAKIREEGKVPNFTSYLACSSLPTGFSTQGFTQEEIEKIKTSPYPDEMQREILNQPDRKYEATEAGKIIKFDALADHAFANAETPTLRTLLILRPEIVPSDGGYNNPWLEEVYDKLKKSGGCLAQSVRSPA